MTGEQRTLARVVRAAGRAVGPARGKGPPRPRAGLPRTIARLVKRWNDDGNILGVGLGQKRVAGKAKGGSLCLICFVATKIAPSKVSPHARISPSLEVDGLGGPLATDVVEIGTMPMLQVGPAANAAHFTLRAGTVTAVVRSLTTPAGALILSCAHVLSPRGAVGLEIESPPDPSSSTKTNHIANLLGGEPLKPGASAINLIDAAVASPLLGVPISNTLPGGGVMMAASALESGAFRRNGITRFNGFGGVTPFVRGELIAESVATVLRDDRGNVFRFSDLIAYRPQPGTRPGDSGMPIVRSTPAGLELIGMHIGASVIAATGTAAAFFVPISRVFRRLGVTLA